MCRPCGWCGPTYLLYAVQRGEIAPLGMGAMVQKLFLEGATDVRG